MNNIAFVLALSLTTASLLFSVGTSKAEVVTGGTHSTQPQLTTSSRLLKLGETITFNFYLPNKASSTTLDVFPQYLEQAQPAGEFVAGGSLAWLDSLPAENHAIKFTDGRAFLTYKPKLAGNYLARWKAGEETFYRYFAVIENDWVVVRYITFTDLESEPTLHATGIPLDYRLPIERFDSGDSLFRKLLDYHRHYGDTIIPHFPDTPELTVDERVRVYGDGLKKVRSLLPDPSDSRAVRVQGEASLDPGYIETFTRLGINNHCGMWAVNGDPWLGMPEFPYFCSPVNFRKPNQELGGAVIAHQWDFCGSWHFIGPPTWHETMYEGQWDATSKCLRSALDELKNLTELSGYPAFAFPLYDSASVQFAEWYQRQIAFELPKIYKLAYARSIDIADYYRRHFSVTPRTVFVSKTDHVMYDMLWLPLYYNQRLLLARERLPWDTRISTIIRLRKAVHPYKDPLSFEYVEIEDQRRQMRFERECPNPIWWFDYTDSQGRSQVPYTETPDVEVIRSKWVSDGNSLKMNLKMRTTAEFPDYAICLWGVPTAYSADRSRIHTNAKDFILAKNTDGEFHLILIFDLKPDAELQVTIRQS